MPTAVKSKAKSLNLLPAVLKNNSLDMAAVVGTTFGTLAFELQSKVIDAADKDGQITSKVTGTLDWLTQAWRKSFEEYKQALFEKMYFAARAPYEAEAVLYSYYFGIDTLEAKGSYNSTFGVKTGPFWDDYIERQARKNVEAAASRIYNDGLNLSGRLWNLDQRSYRQIQSTFMMGVTQKKSAIEIAKELEKHLKPDAKWTRWGYSRLNQMTPADRAKDFKGLLRKPNPIPLDRTPPTKGISYNALRLARHELNTIGVNASLDSIRAQPWTTGEKWNLSPAHNVFDICDEHASGGPNQDGVYLPGSLPMMPAHVSCYCFPTSEMLGKEEFISGLRDWVHGGSWPEMDAYAARLQGSPGYGSIMKQAQAVVGKASAAKVKTTSKERAGADAAIEKALSHGLETNTEILIAVDTKTGGEIISQAGEHRAVRPTEEFFKILQDADKNSIILVHNHPSSSAISVDDINFMLKHESVKRMEVIGHDGTKYFLSRPKGYIYNRNAIFADHKAAIDKYFLQYYDQVMAGGMTNDEAWKEHTHEALLDFAKLYKMKYKRVLPK